MAKDLSEIKNTLIAQQAIYKREVEEAKNAIESIREMVNGISEEDYAKMERIGFSISFLKTFDLERMKVDAEYLGNCKQVTEEAFNKLYNKLLEELDV